MLEYPYESHFVETPGLKIHYLKEGSGPPLLLLHGWPQTAYMWRHQIEYLKQFFTVYAPDNRGFGLTDKPHIRVTRDVLARDVIAFMDELGICQASIAGHDWGGMIAFKVAVDFPDRCRALVLIDTSTTVWPKWAGHAYWAKQSEQPVQFFKQCGEEFVRWCLHGEEAKFDNVDSPFPAKPLPADYGWCDRQALQHYVDALMQPGSQFSSIEYYRSGLPFHRVGKTNEGNFVFDYIGESGSIDIWRHPDGFWAHPDTQRDMCFAPEDWYKKYSKPSLFLFSPLLVPKAFKDNAYYRDFELGEGLWEHAFVRALPNLKYRGILSGHFIPEEASTLVNKALLDFLT